MGHHSDSARPVQQRNRVSRRQDFFGLVQRLAQCKISVERLLHRPDHAFSDQSLGEVGAGDDFRLFAVFRVLPGGVPHIVHRHRQAERGHLFRHLRVAERPAPAQLH